jgi:photosystem II stability/assembly factor-like uncharacterized protein
LVENVHFADELTGWSICERKVPGDPSKEYIRYRIAGEHELYVPALFRTTDSGHTWTPGNYPDLKLITNHLEFADTKHGLSVELNAMQFTTDGGRTWRRSRYCPGTDMRLHEAEMGSDTFTGTAAQLLDSRYGWWTVEGDIFRTTNGGRTWCRQRSIQYHGFLVVLGEIRFASRYLGWALPRSFPPPTDEPTPLFETQDGGVSWHSIKIPKDARIDGMSVVSSDTVYFWGDRQLWRLTH